MNHRLGLSALASKEDRARIFCSYARAGVQWVRFCLMMGPSQQMIRRSRGGERPSSDPTRSPSPAAFG